MEEGKKLFSQKAIALATFLGTPVAAGYLVKKNYEAFNEEGKGRKAFIAGIVSTLLLFAGIFLIPEHMLEKIPNSIIPGIYTIAIYFIVQWEQGDFLEEHEKSKGDFYSNWRAAGIGMISLISIVVTVGCTAFIAGDLYENDFDSVKYDNEVSHFLKNEEEALQVFNVIETAEPPYLLKELNKGSGLWNENIDIVNGIISMEGLPIELIEQNKLLIRYCELRIEHYKLVSRTLLEDTDIYVSKIEKIGLEIEVILSELNE